MRAEQKTWGRVCRTSWLRGPVCENLECALGLSQVHGLSAPVLQGMPQAAKCEPILAFVCFGARLSLVLRCSGPSTEHLSLNTALHLPDMLAKDGPMMLLFCSIYLPNPQDLHPHVPHERCADR